MDAIFEFGIDLIRSIQVLSPALDIPMQFFTFLGTVEFYLLFITFIYWLVDARLGVRIFILLLTTDLVSMGIKQFFHQPRPYWVSDVKQMGIEPTYGLPSSHASDSLATWGYLAYHLRKHWMWLSVLLLVLLISFSRLYLGVHFPQDLLVGWGIGFLVLLAFIKSQDSLSAKIQSWSLITQVGFGFLFSLAFILLGILVQALIAAAPDPQSWAHYSVDARSIAHYCSLAGSFFGSFAGYYLMKRFVPFLTPEKYLHKAAAYLVGVVGVLVLLYGLDVLFALLAVDESVLGYILRYIRYGSVALWALFAAPWVFVKMGLTVRTG